MNNRTSLVVLLVAVAAAIGVVMFWKPQFNNAPSVSDTDSESELEDVNADFPDVDYDGTPYGIDDETVEFYLTKDDGTREVITTPFDLNAYHGQVARTGTLFWKRGPEKSAVVEGFDEPMPYEAGADPDFQWYDVATKKFSAFPKLDLPEAATTFERVYGAYPSISESKIVVEIGRYDTTSDAFTPGLVDGQPVSTYGVVLNTSTAKIETGDPLTTFREALSISSTLFMGMSWDSQRGIAVGVPGGEGCGAYDVLKFVNLKTKAVTTAGGPGSFTFSEEECNPSNAISINERWLALYGTTKDGQRHVYIFDHEHGTTPVKDKSFTPSTDEEGYYLDTFDTSKEFPVLTFTDGTVVDLNS